MLLFNSNKMRLNDGYDISLKKKINRVKKKIKKYINDQDPYLKIIPFKRRIKHIKFKKRQMNKKI